MNGVEDWHRMVSLLAMESINADDSKGLDVGSGCCRKKEFLFACWKAEWFTKGIAL